MARRSKYTPEITAAVIEAMESGMKDADACSVAGISEATFYGWQKSKPEFLDRTTRARPKGWLRALKGIRKAGEDGDWRADAEFLDRTHSPYRKTQETMITGADGAPLKVIIERIEKAS